ncbi:Mur ligase [Bombardia bombarda]|uniref:dihydrofolate synthase n=1 Tax=Bombardia bombarda TaxID=252184 RepID=A0AA39XK85_9PEZI|nr:Mur ligase [Bombardia bombarda]
MIDLGLARIGRLLQHTPQTWKAIHVAGTNGKGSICAYLSAMLSASGQSCARFTSPHLIDRWDCITVNEKPVSESVFRDVEKLVKQRDRDGHIGATEFELLAATAFEIFHRQQVDFGVIEVGLGGKLDATNALKQKSVTVIAKIGLDHQSFLGSTLEEIALHKAGIMRARVPCVVDGSNPPSVLEAIEAHAREVGTDVHYPSTAELAEALLAGGGLELEPHQLQNLACADLACRLACPDHDHSPARLLPIVRQLQWPGRLQQLDIQKITGRQQPVLLDGAHNTQSAQVLASFVQKHVRCGAPQGQQPVVWVLAATQGKDMDGILGLLLQPGDKVVAVRFGPVDGMPWVRPTDPSELLQVASRHGVEAPDDLHDAGNDVAAALTWASARADGGPLVIAGSLYLVSSVLRLLLRLHPRPIFPPPSIQPVHEMPPPNHLIIVCGHAIWCGGPKNGWDEAEWLIESYKQGETPTFIEHIKAGVRILRSDERAVLAFSGGPTREETAISEARSYYNLAVANSCFGFFPASPPPATTTSSSTDPLLLTSRILLEERALDSYYNILFSIIEFWRCHAVWPERLTIVSHAFKRTRLVDAHCAAIGFPLNHIDFVGINPPGVDSLGPVPGSVNVAADGHVLHDKATAMLGVQLAVGQWAEDPHGVGEALAEKRRMRNCWKVDQRLFLSAEERVRSGVHTRMLQDRGEALVDDDEARPWGGRP